MQFDTNGLKFLRKVMNAINCMNLAPSKTVTEQDQLSKLFCQVCTMFSTERMLLENLLCSDSFNKTEIGGVAILPVFLSLASKPSERPKDFCLVFYWPAGTSSYAEPLAAHVAFCSKLLCFFLQPASKRSYYFSGLYFDTSLFLTKISHLENPLFVLKQSESI